ncbi:hypothetical protein GHI93_09695 [Lactococcus hircilactis]|uniref:Gram-positive cocci surface proteins LPxTG domain-containing protein n=1 Tax=Lactococcus hircilactis TaxID=1494462 RepID=A0A7X1Z9A9_9LACT|nr:bacterial Ig-like domain-containing protein [Lactococcus hircilactis]MQW40198.1 hypothetical protein [Lactococcus hircilactis]
MGKYQSKHDVKQTNFRTWKSGKIWIYAAGALLTLGAAGVFGTVPSSPVALSTRAFADTQQQAKANVTGAVSGTNLTITASSSQAGTNSGTTGDSISTINFTDTKSGDSITLSAKNNYSEEFGGAITWKDNKTGETGTATAAIDYKNNTVNLVTIRDDAPTGLSYKDQSNLEVQNFTYIIGDKFDASKGFENATDASGNAIAFSSVKVDSSKVDLKTQGVYPVSYSIVDSATGKTLTKVANVSVRNDAAYIGLFGSDGGTDDLALIKLGSKFDASQYFGFAQDMNENSVDFSQVTVDTSKLNTSKAGIYPVYYSIPDPSLSGGKFTMVLNVTVGSPLTGDASTFDPWVMGTYITKGNTDWAIGDSGSLLGDFSEGENVDTSGTKIILKSPDSSTATFDSAAVDTNTLGTYQVPITVIDPIGNSQTMYATVVVSQPSGWPGYYNPTWNIDLPVGSSYSPTYGIDTGYYSVSNEIGTIFDSDLTYTTQSNVNMKVPGVYQTVYTLTASNLAESGILSGSWNVTANVRVYDDTDHTALSAPKTSTGTIGQVWSIDSKNGLNVTQSDGSSADGNLVVALIKKPTGSKADVEMTNPISVTFTPDVAGDYTLTYTYTDLVTGKVVSASTVVNVAASTTPSGPTNSTDNLLNDVSISTNNITINQNATFSMKDLVNSFTNFGPDANGNGNGKTGSLGSNMIESAKSWNSMNDSYLNVDTPIDSTTYPLYYIIPYGMSEDRAYGIWFEVDVSKVDTSKVGTYTVTYKGIDMDGSFYANLPYDGLDTKILGTSTVTVVAPKDQSALSAPSHYDMTTGQTYDVSTSVKALNAAGQVVSPTYQVSAQDVKGQMIDTTGLLMGTSFAPKVAGTYTVTVTNGTKKASLKIAVAPSQVSPIVDEVTDNTAPSDPISSTDKVLIGTVTVKKVGDAFNAYDDYVTGAVSENNQPASSGAQTTMASAIQALLVKQYPDLATQIKSGYLNSTGVLTNLVGVHIISNNVNMNKAGTYVVNYLIDGATMTFTTGDPLPAQIIDLKNLIVTRTVIVEADTVSTPSQGKGQTPKSGSESTSTTLNSNGKNQVSMLATTQVKSAAQPMVKTAVASATLLPKTGDHSSVTLAETLLGLSFVGLSGLFLEMKRRRL